MKITRLPQTVCDHSRLCFKCGAFEFFIGMSVGMMGVFMYASVFWW